MTPDEYKFLYELEEHHWWFVGMRKVVAALLDRAAPAERLRILDAGCGTGLMLAWLRRYGKDSAIFGLDISSDAVYYASLRGEKLLIQGSIAALPLPNNSFDVVVTLDVLDRFSLQEVATPFAELERVLKERGWLLVRVPAYQLLYSQHDKVVQSVHRYTAIELAQQLEWRGLRVERVTYANTFLFPAAALWRRISRSGRGLRSDVRPLPAALRWANPILASILGIEAAWLRRFRWGLPFGLSVIALARKPAREM